MTIIKSMKTRLLSLSVAVLGMMLVIGSALVWASVGPNAATGTVPAQDEKAKPEKSEKACMEAGKKRDEINKKEGATKEEKDAAQQALKDACPSTCYYTPKGCRKVPANCQQYSELFSRLDQQCGLPQGTAATTANIESACQAGLGGTQGNADDMANHNKGLFQFMQSDCTDKGNGNMPGFTQADLYNPEKQGQCLCNEMQAMRKKFVNRIGREPTAAEYYIMHQQRNAALCMFANPNAPVTNCTKAEYISGNGGNPNGTAGEFLNRITSIYNQKSIDGTGSDYMYAGTATPYSGNSYNAYGQYTGGGMSPGMGYSGNAYNPYGQPYANTAGNSGSSGNTGTAIKTAANTTTNTTSAMTTTTDASGTKVIIITTGSVSQTYTLPKSSQLWNCNGVMTTATAPEASTMTAKACVLLTVN